MSEIVSSIQIKDLIKLRNDKSKQLKSLDYMENGILPIVDQGKSLICGYTDDLSKRYDKGLPVIIFGDHTLQTKFVDFDFAVGADGTQIIVPSNKSDDIRYLYYLIQMVAELIGSEGYKRHINILKEFTTPYIKQPAEQRKIASILTSIDNTIGKIRSKIKKFQNLKKSVMNDLMNKGINHKEFKDTEFGKIPKTWNIYKYDDLLKIVDNKVEMKDDEFYQLLSIRRRNGGVFIREKLIGKKILTKTLGKTIVNTFIISKMQIVHGASGYISEKFKEHYVSSSYIQFAAKDENKLSTKFLFYYSHLDKVYKQFLESSQGVHIEKMTFDLKDWLKKEIILPNIEEQQKIVRIIESFENHISNIEKKLIKYNFLKKSILKDLITGKVRVKVN